MPPGSAKSTYTSVLFPAWFISRPRVNVIGASNSATLAEDFSRRVLSFIREHSKLLGCSLARENAELWETTAGSRYRAAGVGGTIAGHRADVVLIDDPIRGREDAESERIRDKAWNWYTADLLTRLRPGGRIVLIQTRWHEDDLAGRILEREPGRWRVIKLPAIAGEDDLLGRAPGEFLWSDDEYGYGNLLKQAYARAQQTGAMRDWASLYQQEPRPADGAIFKTRQIVVEDAAPARGETVRAWDLAATAQLGTHDPDWTVGVKLRRTVEGRFYVLDVVRMRGGPDEVEATIVNTAKLDGPTVKIGLPQDPGQSGKQQVLYLTRKLLGFKVESSPESGSKTERASPVASQVNVGNFSIMRGSWNAAFLDELASFDSGRKKDQVDALSRAFGMVIVDKIAIWARLNE